MKIKIIEIASPTVGRSARDVEIRSGKRSVEIKTGQRLMITKIPRGWAAKHNQDIQEMDRHDRLKVGMTGSFDSLGQHRGVGDFKIETHPGVRMIWGLRDLIDFEFKTVSSG